MPQLDVNTFLNQYSGIIAILLVTYFILSYIVLPILLSQIIVRSKVIQPSVVAVNSQLLVNVDKNAQSVLLTKNLLGYLNMSKIINKVSLTTPILFSTLMFVLSILSNNQPIILNTEVDNHIEKTAVNGSSFETYLGAFINELQIDARE